MAEKPDVLKRLEPENWADSGAQVKWLLSLTRALLKSQGELMDWIRPNAPCERQECVRCQMLTRAEKVRRGEV